MPSDTFLRLSNEKKRKLLEASYKEFETYNFSDASINRIIKEANISRGSFYMYFQDKKDLYFYLLEQHGKNLCSIMKESLIKNNGDLFLMFHEVIETCYYSLIKEHPNFFKKSIENITIIEETKKTFGFRDKKLLKELIPNINLELLSDNAKRHIEVIFAINMHLLMVSLIKLLTKLELDKNIITNYHEQLDIIKNGVVKTL